MDHSDGDWCAFIKTITYKKDWRFGYLYDLDYNQNYILVEARVEDSRNPGQMITVRMKHKVEPLGRLGEHQAQELVRFLIHELERHEVDEWFRIDGTLVHDPHEMDVV